MNKYDINDDKTYILGIALIIEAIKNKPSELSCVYLSSNVIKSKEYDLLLSLCNKNNIEVIEDDKVINSLSLKENCYGIGIINKFKTKLLTNKHLVLVNYNDEGEIGTIIRSLASFDFKDLVLINSDIDIYNPRIIRSSMGGFFHINIEKYDSLDEYNSIYHLKNIHIGLNGHKELKNINVKDNYSLIINSDIDVNDYYLEHNINSSLNYSSITSICLSYLYNR